VSIPVTLSVLEKRDVRVNFFQADLDNNVLFDLKRSKSAG